MATTCPVGFDRALLRSRVADTYTRVAEEPHGDFHFHRGASYAAELLGYDAAELAALPRHATDRFAGVGNPLALGPVRPGEVVLDHACGGGMDLLLAARRVGPSGRAIGVDMTPAMRDAAQLAAEKAGLAPLVEIRAGLFEALPLDDASVDVVISNGVINLAPDKPRVLAEVARVLRPGGRALIADVIVARELTLPVRQSPELWAACVGGAMQEAEMIALALDAGLIEARAVARWECFRGTSAEAKVKSDLRIGAVGFTMRKPG